MSGHSKWSTIKRKKEKTDGQRAKIFTKMAREISVCVKEHGGDITTNSKLKDIVSKAKGLNVPNDNIDRAIKKANDAKGEDYEAIRYEGYGPNGIAVIVDTLTDNRNRTASNMRLYFDKYGGNLGQVGCVGFMFNQKGIIIINNDGLDEEKVMEDCFEAGAEDFETVDDIFEVITDVQSFSQTRHGLQDMGYTIESAELEYIPVTMTAISDADDIKKMTLLLDHLENDDDVQSIWNNLENEEILDR